MQLCPLCLHDNDDDASVCGHCGRYRFRDGAETELADEESVTVQAPKVREVSDELRFRDPEGPRSSTPTLPVIPALNIPKTGEVPVLPKARLVVIRGQKLNAEYPLYTGPNYLGRTADRPADIDLSTLEPPEQVWSSRQHAVVHNDNGALCVEDLNSLNGTFVNRTRIQAGKKYLLKNDDVIQIGTVQLRVVT